jgi:hypothetical protein
MQNEHSVVGDVTILGKPERGKKSEAVDKAKLQSVGVFFTPTDCSFNLSDL